MERALAPSSLREHWPFARLDDEQVNIRAQKTDKDKALSHKLEKHILIKLVLIHLINIIMIQKLENVYLLV